MRALLAPSEQAAQGGRLKRASLLIAAVLLVATPGLAAGRPVRPRFEPTDLELEASGMVEVDLQAGFVEGASAGRALVPDFEVDLGLTRAVELDVDGSYAVEGRASARFSFDHPAPDSLWTAVKVGLLSSDGEAIGVGVGLQLGPKIPVAPGSRGLGGEGLLLLGLRVGRAHLVLDLGGFVEPAPGAVDPRPRGLEAGLDADVDLDRDGHFSLDAELGGVRFFSTDPHQMTGTLGVAWAPRESLEFSLTALVGFLRGSDRYGLLLGFSPKVMIFI
jgi:hypothetical protein